MYPLRAHASTSGSPSGLPGAWHRLLGSATLRVASLQVCTPGPEV